MSIAEIILISSLLPTISGSGAMPVNTPSAENLFILARELYGRKLVENLEYSYLSVPEQGGYSEFEQGLAEAYGDLLAPYLREYDRPKIRLGLETVGLGRLEGSAGKSFLKLFPKLVVDLRSDLRASVTYRIDREVSENSDYDGKYWRGWAGFVEDASVEFSPDKMCFRFGLERVAWGMGRYGNLLFSKQAMPMTSLGFSYGSDRIRFESVCGFLSPLKEELDGRISDPDYFTSQQRYLAAHSLTVRPFESLSVSIREAVIYGGPGRRFEPAYAFPLIWYHGYQLNSRIDDNTLVSAAMDYRYGGRLWVYGELLIDDLQIESAGPGDNEPDQIGFLLGGEFYGLFLDGTRIALEYARINNWVFNQPRPHNRYINRNIPIGFPDGPDNDILNWELSWWPAEFARLAYSGMYQRVGEGGIDADWTAPWLDSPGYSESFPTGTVQRAILNGLSLLVLNKNKVWGKMKIQLTDIENVGNISSRSKTDREFSLELGYNLPPFGWGF